MCNEKLKFGALLDRARQLGGDYVATGHFARLEKRADGRMLLKKGCDPRKDQSYFLFPCARINWPAPCFRSVKKQTRHAPGRARVPVKNGG